MITKNRIALTIAALAVIASGCSSASIAATVNGETISRDDVLALRTDTDGEVVVDAGRLRNDLSRLVVLEALLSAAESEYGLTDFDSPEAREEFLAAAPSDLLLYLDAIPNDPDNPNLSQRAVDVDTTLLILRTEVRDALAHDEENLQDVWESDQAMLTGACMSHILVETEEAASSVLDRLDAGEDFAELATEVSTDTASPGGALPCPTQIGALVEPFPTAIPEAPLGQVQGPVQSVFGWHVFVVDSIVGPRTFEEFAADPTRWISSDIIDRYWSDWLNESVDSADIDVRGDIGEWYGPVDGIIAPPASP